MNEIVSFPFFTADITAAFATAFTAAAAAGLAHPLLLRWGVSNAARWIEPQSAQSLRAFSWPWWLSCVVIAAGLGLMQQGPEFAQWSRPPLELSEPLELSGISGLLGLSGLSALSALSALLGLWVASLAALAQIDLKTRLLPDALTLFMVATGLLFHAMSGFGITKALVGAAVGYGGLWALAKGFELVRKQTAGAAMGRGDFAMLAGIGAWLGWQALPLVLLVASLAALIFAAAAGLIVKGKTIATYIPFGPALGAGALVSWLSAQ